MSTEPREPDDTYVLEEDDPPKDGQWLDSENILSDPTPAEMAQGLLDGQVVNDG